MDYALLPALWVAWPVLLVTGVLLGLATSWAADKRSNLGWYSPILLISAAAFVTMTGGSVSTPLTAPEKLGVGVVAMAIPVVVALGAALWVLGVRARRWVLVAAPAIACFLCTPVAGYVAMVTICELTGDCL